MKEINIAIVAHDGRKKELMGWVEYNWKLLSQYNIYATGTTGRLIEELVVKDGKHLLKPKIIRAILLAFCHPFSPVRLAETSR